MVMVSVIKGGHLGRTPFNSFQDEEYLTKKLLMRPCLLLDCFGQWSSKIITHRINVAMILLGTGIFI